MCHVKVHFLRPSIIPNYPPSFPFSSVHSFTQVGLPILYVNLLNPPIHFLASIFTWSDTSAARRLRRTHSCSSCHVCHFTLRHLMKTFAKPLLCVMEIYVNVYLLPAAKLTLVNDYSIIRGGEEGDHVQNL